MEKSTWTKIVWLGAISAIPVAIMAVRKPEAPRAAPAPRRVIIVDQPVSVDISDLQIEGPKPAEAVSVEAQKPLPVRLGTEKITSKGAAAAPVEPAPTKSDILGPKEQNLAAVLAPVAGPQAVPTR